MVIYTRCCMFLVLTGSLQLYGPGFLEQKREKESEQAVFNKALKEWNAAVAAYKTTHPEFVEDVYDQKTVEGRKVQEAQRALYRASKQLKNAQYKEKEEASLKGQELHEARLKKEEEERKKLEAERAVLKAQRGDKEAGVAAAQRAQSTQSFLSPAAQAHGTYAQQSKSQAASRRPLLSHRFARGRLGHTVPSTLPSTVPQPAVQSAQALAVSAASGWSSNNHDDGWEDAYSQADIDAADAQTESEYDDNGDGEESM